MSIRSKGAVRATTVRRINLTIAALAIALAAACGGGSELDFDSLDPATQNLVAFESGWQCEVGRFAVDDPGELEQLRLDRQDEHEITPGAYQAFLDRLATDEDLAGLVSERTSTCLDSGEPVQL